MKTWTVKLEEDPETGELILPFTDEMLEGLGWAEGDTIEWIDNKDGTWSLVKKTNEFNIKPHAVELFAPLAYQFTYNFKWNFLEQKITDYFKLAERNSELEKGSAWSTVYIQNNQPHTWKEFFPFFVWVDKIIKQVGVENRLLSNKYRVVRSWINKHSTGGVTLEHHHNQTNFVIVCYLQCPPNSGNIVFVDPLEYHKNGYPISTIDPEKFRSQEISVQTNDVIIFPGWLKHYTTPNNSNEDRYIMSIDIVFEF